MAEQMFRWVGCISLGAIPWYLALLAAYHFWGWSGEGVGVLFGIAGLLTGLAIWLKSGGGRFGA